MLWGKPYFVCMCVYVCVCVCVCVYVQVCMFNVRIPCSYHFPKSPITTHVHCSMKSNQTNGQWNVGWLV